jgi:hypothetical protein
MKISPRILLLSLLLAPLAQADEVTSATLKEFIAGMADLDAAYLSAHEKKTPIKDFEAVLTVAKARLLEATAKPGVGGDLVRELTAWASVYDKAAQTLAKDPVAEEQRLWRAADDLAALSQMARTLGGLAGAGPRLTSAERKALGGQVESRFGRKVQEYPRGDVSPFASGSRSPFASAMWLVNLAFDDSVKR